jgi:DNA polymerase-1
MKTIILAIMYGLGLGRLAERLAITVDEATKFRNAILRALPGVKMLTSDLKARGRLGQPMITWGGRRYLAEPTKIVDGKIREFGYKLVNYLIQGSSADITKEAMIRYEANKVHGLPMISVHDELLIRCPKEHAVSEMKILRETMNTVELDAPLVSDGAVGTRWGTLEDCE